MASLKVEICLKKKTTPSTNIPLLSFRKSEQNQQDCSYQGEALNVPTAY